MPQANYSNSGKSMPNAFAPTYRRARQLHVLKSDRICRIFLVTQRRGQLLRTAIRIAPSTEYLIFYVCQSLESSTSRERSRPAQLGYAVRHHWFRCCAFSHTFEALLAHFTYHHPLVSSTPGSPYNSLTSALCFSASVTRRRTLANSSQASSGPIEIRRSPWGKWMSAFTTCAPSSRQ